MKEKIIDENGIPERLRTLRYPVFTRKKNNEYDKLELVGARPLHLAAARPFCRLKAPLGLSLLRCARKREFT